MDGRGISKHRTVLVYVAFVLAVAVVLFGWQRHINHRFEQRDDASCRDRRVLIDNQRLVLRYLHSHAGTEIDRLNGRQWRLEFVEGLLRVATPCATQ